MSETSEALWRAAEFACEQATTFAGQRLRTLHGGRNCFYPVIDEKNKTVGVGIVQDYYYLVYQERGFATFPMTWALGRTIPITLPDGSVIFRTCTAVGVPQEGYRGYWYRDNRGKLVERYEQKRSWVHPGVGPHNFLRDAVRYAVVAYSQEVTQATINDAENRFVRRIERRVGSVWQRLTKRVSGFFRRFGTRNNR